MGNVEIWQMANVVSKPPQIIFTHKIQFLVRNILFPLNVKKNLNQWHDSCGVIDSFEGWLLLRIFKLPHHLSFILAVIIYSRKFTRKKNSLNCKHRTYMPTSITGQMISAMKTCKHTDRKMCVQELAFQHVKALPFCPFGPFNWQNMSTK